MVGKKKVPKRIDFREIAEQIKARVLFSDEIGPDFVPKVAQEMGIEKKTVYDYLDRRIKLNLDFLHAIVISSDGDPVLKSYLEPEGWSLRKVAPPKLSERTLPEDLLSTHSELAKLERLLTKSFSRSSTNQFAAIEVQFMRVVQDLRSSVQKWKVENGIA